MKKNLLIALIGLVSLVFTQNVFAQYQSMKMKKTVIDNNYDQFKHKIVPDWSRQINDPAIPTLKVRERHYVLGDNQILEIELTATKYAQGNFTASTCNENRTLNGWQFTELKPNQPKILRFETTNTCNNGWWWQTNGYQVLSDWTAWTAFDNNGLKARMSYSLDAAGQKIINLQIESKKRATLRCAINVCTSNSIEQNGWRKIQIEANKPTNYQFAYKNTCADGWWWQYKNYERLPGLLENDVELNPVDD